MGLKLDSLSAEQESCNALSEITNFIAQEIYKLALLRQYPNECRWIFTLAWSITNSLEHLFGQGFDYELEELRDTLVDLIASRANESEFEKYVNRALHINNIDIPKSENTIDSLDVNDNSNTSFNVEQHELEIKTAALNVARKLFLNNINNGVYIQHKFPPRILCYQYDYFEMLAYFHGLYYRAQVKGNTISIHQAPYKSFLPYEDRVIENIKYVESKLNVPETALSKRNSFNFSCDDAIQAFFSMLFHRGEQPRESVIKTDEICFNIDLSEPLTDKILDRTLANWRGIISFRQFLNSASSMILAESEADLIQAYNTPHLKRMEHTEFKRLYKVTLPELNSPSQAKAYLCGLIVLYRHFVRVDMSSTPMTCSWGKNEDGLSTLLRFTEISAELSKIHGKEGFSAGSIEKGYKLVKAVFNHYIADFQRGRVQFNVYLNEKQRDALKKVDPVRLEQLHPEDVEKVKEEIERLRRKGKEASVKAKLNGSFVITW